MFSKCFIDYLICLSVLNVCFWKSFAGTLEVGERKCPDPVLKQNGSETFIDAAAGLSGGIVEVKFNGAFGKAELKRYCKIKCINGEWVGPLCLADGGSGGTVEEGKFYPVLRSCNSRTFHSKFVVSHRNKTVRGSQDFPHDSIVQVRCKQFGMYKLIGDTRLTCHNGLWKHRIPKCVPTTSLTNFSDESAPPSLLAKVTSGSASVEPNGEFAVYPGSTVHLECLFPRSSGTPQWSWTSSFRSYATGWSIDSEEREWKYRLSIYYIKSQDTGIYTCSTPKGLTHSIVLNVIEVHCKVSEILTNDPNLLIHTQGSRLGQSTTYKCREGFKLNGTSMSICQASGIWSADCPTCVPVVCPTLDVKNNLVEIIKQDSGFGGTAIFKCPEGSKLSGVATLVCLATGEWSGKMPSCREVYCTPPVLPQNGKLKYNNESLDKMFRIGSTLTFSCKKSYKIVGQGTIKCQETGVWSNPPPFCKTYCNHPGDPLQGIYSPRKTEYEIGDRISLNCFHGYELNIRTRSKCQKNGQWSEPFQECRKSNSVIVLKPKTTVKTIISTVDASSIFSSISTTKPVPQDFTNQPSQLINLLTNNSTKKFNFTFTEPAENKTDLDFYVIEEQPG